MSDLRKDLTLQQKLDGLAIFAAYFQRPDADYGKWDAEPGKPIYPELSAKALEFANACYSLDWLERFDYSTWSSTEEATQLRDDPEAIDDATPQQLGRILTVVLRADHFSDGAALMQAFESGLIQRVLSRIAALAAE